MIALVSYFHPETKINFPHIFHPHLSKIYPFDFKINNSGRIREYYLNSLLKRPINFKALQEKSKGERGPRYLSKELKNLWISTSVLINDPTISLNDYSDFEKLADDHRKKFKKFKEEQTARLNKLRASLTRIKESINLWGSGNGEHLSPYVILQCKYSIQECLKDWGFSINVDQKRVAYVEVETGQSRELKWEEFKSLLNKKVIFFYHSDRRADSLKKHGLSLEALDANEQAEINQIMDELIKTIHPLWDDVIAKIN